MKHYDSLSQLVEKKLNRGKNTKRIMLAFIVLAFIVIFIGIATKEYLWYIFSIVIFYGAFSAFVVYIDCFRAVSQNFKWLEEKGIGHIASDVDINNPTYPKAKICCGNYAFVLRDSGIVLPYSELIWAYAYEHRINGIRVEKSFRVHTKNGKMYTLKLSPEEFVAFLKEYVARHSPNFMLGYSKPNQKLYKKIVKEEKKKQK